MNKKQNKLLGSPEDLRNDPELEKGFLNLKQFKFKMSPETLEPLVKPADPEVIPEIVPKKEPEEDSPWNVPGPKVDPTPKGKYIF
ncbi:MAG TPA: hypothetical protein VMX17_17350 [Candidatus Glassbacteria bacterium]|nr:hypothetical protein [Candidatus Glassbacteria bacterium]